MKPLNKILFEESDSADFLVQLPCIGENRSHKKAKWFGQR